MSSSHSPRDRTGRVPEETNAQLNCNSQGNGVYRVSPCCASYYTKCPTHTNLTSLVFGQPQEVATTICSLYRGHTASKWCSDTGDLGSLVLVCAQSTALHAFSRLLMNGKAVASGKAGHTPPGTIWIGKCREPTLPTPINSPSQTDGLERYHGCLGHGNPLPDESRWRGQHT